MRPLSRRGFLVTVGLSASAIAILAEEGDDDVILRAMRDELARSLQLRVVGGGGDNAPYFIGYTVSDSEEFTVSATLGSVTSSGRGRYRLPGTEVRVGSYDFDNTGHIFSGLFSGSRYDTDPWPLDDNYQNLRDALWLSTDFAYKAAVESISRKRAALTNMATAPDRLADYSKADPVTSIEKIAPSKLDEPAWTARTTKLSALFASYPGIVTSSVEFHFSQGTTYLVNTEGTKIRFADNVAWLIARAQAQASDGMLLREGATVQTVDLNHFPSDAELQQAVSAVAANLTARAKAPVGAAVGESFSGPVLFEPRAAAQLCAQLLGGNFRVPRKPISDGNRQVTFVASEFEGRIGSRVLPEWLDVVDDPTQTTWQGKPLAGYYSFDVEGVKPKAVSLIEKGVLKSFLSTRQPVKGIPVSNGHARLPGGYGVSAAAISNLFVKSSQADSLAALKAQLIQMCSDRGKPYGMLVRSLDYPFSASTADLQALLAASAQSGGSVRAVSPPTLIFRVYPDGREELVRGLRFRGMSTRSLRDILAASSETAVFEFVNNGAPMALLGAGGTLAPAAVIAPGLLFDELELERPQEQMQTMPLVPPPTS